MLEAVAGMNESETGGGPAGAGGEAAAALQMCSAAAMAMPQLQASGSVTAQTGPCRSLDLIRLRPRFPSQAGASREALCFKMRCA